MPFSGSIRDVLRGCLAEVGVFHREHGGIYPWDGGPQPLFNPLNGDIPANKYQLYNVYVGLIAKGPPFPRVFP